MTVSPKHDGGLLGSAQLAFDAARGMPLRLAIYAQGSSMPALALAATNISYGAIPASDVDISPPARAKVVDLSSAASSHDSGGPSDTTPQVAGLPAVQAAVDFPVAAPDTLVGLPRQDVRLVGKDAALVVYGQGLGAMLIVERKADPAASNSMSFTALPTGPALQRADSTRARDPARHRARMGARAARSCSPVRCRPQPPSPLRAS